MSISKDASESLPGRARLSRWLGIAGTAWLGLALLLMALLVWTSLLSCPWLVALYLTATVLGSGICFAAYGLDKRRAEKGRFRISESTLQWIAFLGGWPGGLLGQRTFRHKTQKLKFQLLFWLIVCLHVPLIALSLWSIRFGG